LRKLYGQMRITRSRLKNIDDIRNDFPILRTKVYGKPLVYFDNGATTQKPQMVLDKVNEVNTIYNSNIHRGVHALSERASEEYEIAREKVRDALARHVDHEQARYAAVREPMVPVSVGLVLHHVRLDLGFLAFLVARLECLVADGLGPHPRDERHPARVREPLDARYAGGHLRDPARFAPVGRDEPELWLVVLFRAASLPRVPCS